MFSSDDEIGTPQPRRSSRKKKPGTPRKNTAMEKTVAASPPITNVTSLSDNQLFDMLKENGADPGPILESTRRAYQKKLERLLHDKVKAEPLTTIKQRVEPEQLDFSDQDGSPSPVVQVRARRKQQTPKVTVVAEERVVHKNSSVANNSVSATSNSVAATNNVPPVATDNHKEAAVKTSACPVSRSAVRPVVQLMLVVGLAALIYFMIQHMDPWGKSSRIGQLPGAK